MIEVELHITTSHIIAVVLALLAPIAGTLVAWGRLTESVKAMRTKQDSLVSSSDLRAAMAEMKADIYQALGERRDPGNAHDRRRSGNHDASP